MEQKIQNIKEKILGYVKEGKVAMKPKWYFILRSILRIVVILIIFLIIIYFVSFFSLVLSERETLRALDLRPKGIREFLFAIPWLIVFLSLIMLAVLEFLVNKFSFVYKRPLVYSLFAIICFVLLTGFALSKIDRQYMFARFGEKPEVPIFGPMHKFYRGELDKRPFNKDFEKNLKKGFMMPRKLEMGF